MEQLKEQSAPLEHNCEPAEAPPIVRDEQQTVPKITIEVTPGDEEEANNSHTQSDVALNNINDISPNTTNQKLDESSESNETVQNQNDENKPDDATEEVSKEQKTMSREMKSLIASAKESKIISEFTQIKSKVRKSRKDIETSVSSGSANVSLDVEKEPSSRRSSDNSLVSSSSDVSDKTGRRSMRSLNPEFVQKQQKFLESLSGKPTKDEGSASETESEDSRRSVSQNQSQKLSDSFEVSLQVEPQKNKDKYCWRCHWLIEISPTGLGPRHCSVCPRSYHPKCLSSKAGNPEKPGWVCPECMTVLTAEAAETRSPAMQKTSLSTLCTLLNYALARMKLVNGVEEFLQPVDVKQCPDYSEHVVHPMDLGRVQQNIVDGLYGSTEAFLADTLWILHNCLVYNSPVRSRLTVSARSLVRECRKEIGEIEACPECYAAAHARRPTWFTDVCSTPHILLWAKLKGFPFWPAKGMTVNEVGMVDVRFFGDHDRAWVPSKYCFLYSQKDPNNSKIQRSDILESMKEAEQHIKNIVRKFGSFVHAPPKTQFEPARQGEQLLVMIPGYKGVLPAPRFLKECSSNTSSPFNKSKRRRLSSKGSGEGYISDEYEADATQDEDNVSVGGSVRDTSVEVDVESVASSSLKRRKIEQTSNISLNRKRKLTSSSNEKSAERDLPDKKEPIECMEVDGNESKDNHQLDDGKQLSPIKDLLDHEKDKISPEKSNVETTQNESENDKIQTKTSSDTSSQDNANSNSEKCNENELKNETNDIKNIEKSKPNCKITTNSKNFDDQKPHEKSLEKNDITFPRKSKSATENTMPVIVNIPASKKIEKVVQKQKSKSTDNVFGSGDGLPTITSVRSLAGDEANSTFVSKNNSGSKKNPPKKVTSKNEASENIKTSTPVTTKVKSNELQKKTKDQKSLIINTKGTDAENMLVDVKIKTEPIDYDEDEKSLEKNDLLGSLNLRPTSSVDSSTPKSAETRTFRRIVTSKSTTPARARKTFPQPTRKSDNSRADLNGKNSMVYIPIQPPPTSSPPVRVTTVRPNRPPVVNTSSPQRPAVSSNSTAAVTSNSAHTTSTPAVSTPLLTVATNLMPPSPAAHPAPAPAPLAPASPATSAPNVVQTVPMISAFNGQWALCIPPLVNVDPTAPVPMMNGVCDNMLTTTSCVDSTSTSSATAAPRPVITAVPTASLINQPTRELPPLLARPGHPLCPETPVGPLPVPSEAGPCWTQINQSAVKLADYFRSLLTSSLQVLEEPPATVAALRLQLEEAEWRHKQELAELKHNTDVQLIEMRNTIERERASAVAEARRVAEMELNQAVAHAKSKTWCANCRQEAQFYCCWNTSYCDYPCQQAHWTKHMATCTQTRNVDSPMPHEEPATLLKTVAGKTVVARTLNTSAGPVVRAASPASAPNVMMMQTGGATYKRPQLNQRTYLINKQLMNSEESASKLTPAGYLIVGGGSAGRPVVSSAAPSTL